MLEPRPRLSILFDPLDGVLGEGNRDINMIELSFRWKKH